MKISIESSDEKSIIEIDNDDVDIFEAMDLVERVLIAKGYHPDTVKEGFRLKAEEYDIGENNE